MKVYGNYYKNTDRGKKKQKFEIEVKEAGLHEMKEEATKKLQSEDPEFRGIREFFAEGGVMCDISSPSPCVDKAVIPDSHPYIKIDGELYDLLRESDGFPIIYKVGEKVEEVVAPIDREEVCKQVEDIAKDIEVCKQANIERQNSEVRQKAKELKIKNWHNKKIDNLIKEIKDIEKNETKI